MDRHGTDQGGTLTHSAGQFRGFLVLECIEIVILKQLEDIILIFTGQGVVEFQTEGDVLIDGTPFKQMVPLKHIADSDSIFGSAVRKAFSSVGQRT